MKSLFKYRTRQSFQKSSVFGVYICIALHCARAPSLFVAVEWAKMSRQTTPGRFGFKKAFLIEML